MVMHPMIIALKFQNDVTSGICTRNTNRVHGGFCSGTRKAHHIDGGRHLNDHLSNFDFEFAGHCKENPLLNLFNYFLIYFIK